MKYTDIEKLKTDLHRYQLDNCTDCTDIDCGLCFHYLLDDAHVEDVTPVVHGRWVKDNLLPMSPYCPNCGAKMDLEVDDA